jgi:hypothetical protein
MKNKKPIRKRNRCQNCKHAGDHFRIAGKTHMHCLHPAKHTGNAWDTLREFWETCDKYEAEPKIKAE